MSKPALFTAFSVTDAVIVEFRSDPGMEDGYYPYYGTLVDCDNSGIVLEDAFYYDGGGARHPHGSTFIPWAAIRLVNKRLD